MGLPQEIAILHGKGLLVLRSMDLVFETLNPLALHLKQTNQKPSTLFRKTRSNRHKARTKQQIPWPFALRPLVKPRAEDGTTSPRGLSFNVYRVGL